VATPTRIGVLFLGRKRPGFDPEWGAKIHRLVLQQFEDSADFHALFKRLCREGMPHHLAVAGHQATKLRDFANQTGLRDHSGG